MDKDILNIVKELIKAELEDAPSFLHIKKKANLGYPSIIPGNINFGYLGEILSEIELKALIRAIVMHSREAGRFTSGGSTSPINALYCLCCMLYPESEWEMGLWIHENTVNPNYEPGLSPSGQIAKQKDSRRRQLLEDERQVIAKRGRVERDAKKATLNLPNAIRRGDVKAVKVLVEKEGDIKQAFLEVDSLRPSLKKDTKRIMTEYLDSLGLTFKT